jgi:hypothetical protein
LILGFLSPENLQSLNTPALPPSGLDENIANEDKIIHLSFYLNRPYFKFFNESRIFLSFVDFFLDKTHKTDKMDKMASEEKKSQS